MTVTREEHYRELALDTMRVTVPKSCPYYNNGDTCGGDVLFEAFASYGVCQKCGGEVPIIVEV